MLVAVKIWPEPVFSFTTTPSIKICTFNVPVASVAVAFAPNEIALTSPLIVNVVLQVFPDKLVNVATRELAKSKPDLDGFKRKWGEALYKIGIIGVKHAAHLSVLWGYKDLTQVNESHFHDDARIYVHKMLWHELGTRTHH